MKTDQMIVNRVSRLVSFNALVAAIVGAVIVTSACTSVGPDYRIPPQSVLQRTQAAAPLIGSGEAPFRLSPLPSHWWQLYQDPALDHLIQMAFAANTDLRIAAANLERVQAVAQQNARAGDPTVGVSAGPEYGRPSAVSMGLAGPIPDSWLYDVGARISYQLDFVGKISRVIEASKADAQAAEAGYDMVRVTVAAATARAYVDNCAAGQERQVAQYSVDLQDQFVRLIEQRVRAGRGTAFDSSRARSQLEQLRAVIPPLLAQQRIAQFRLAVLVGEVPGALSSELSATLERCHVVPRVMKPIPVGDGAALLKRRPDIREAERRLAAATARIGVVTAELYPEISVGLSVGSTGELADFGAQNASRWGVGPLISWTIPSPGTARSRIAQAEAGSRGALAHFDATVLNGLRESESALALYARELDRHAALQAARDQSALAAKQATSLYRFGRTDLLTALDVDRTLASAESALAMSEAQLAIDQVGLFLALGGGWETENPPTVQVQ